MLVLSRQRDEVIMIGDDIEIMVVDVRTDGTVRLGINAPPHVPVHRKEVYESIKRENVAAAQASGESPRAVESLADKKKLLLQMPAPGPTRRDGGDKPTSANEHHHVAAAAATMM